MKAVFLDTSGWLAALNPRESQHKAALSAYKGWIDTGSMRLITTNLVMAEMQTLVMGYRGVAASLRFLDQVYRDPSHEVVFVDRELDRAATDRWLRKFTDVDLSLADAVSFEVMRQLRIEQALTLDGHFTVAGFSPVP